MALVIYIRPGSVVFVAELPGPQGNFSVQQIAGLPPGVNIRKECDGSFNIRQRFGIQSTLSHAPRWEDLADSLIGAGTRRLVRPSNGRRLRKCGQHAETSAH